MKKLLKSKIILFYLSVVIIFTIPIYTIITNYNILKNGKEYLFKVKVVDPYDMFRGNYIDINFSENTVKGIQQENNSNNYYVTIEKNQDGFAYFKKISTDKPEDATEYYKTTAYYNLVLKEYHIYTPTRYYMNEKKSLNAEKKYKKNIDNTYVKVRVKNGKMVVVGVYVNNVLIDSID